MDFKEIHSYIDLTNERETDFMEGFFYIIQVPFRNGYILVVKKE